MKKLLKILTLENPGILDQLKKLTRTLWRVTEWFKVHAWKACVRLMLYRGFESSLRHITSIQVNKYSHLEYFRLLNLFFVPHIHFTVGCFYLFFTYYFTLFFTREITHIWLYVICYI